jgi:hypothetical protein
VGTTSAARLMKSVSTEHAAICTLTA